MLALPEHVFRLMPLPPLFLFYYFSSCCIYFIGSRCRPSRDIYIKLRIRRQVRRSALRAARTSRHARRYFADAAIMI